jgi:hypothetical protein
MAKIELICGFPDRRGIKNPHYGKKHSEASKNKMRAKRLQMIANNPNWKDRVYTPERNKKISIALSGNKNPNWNGGSKISKVIKNRIRKSREYKQWRKSVFERDDYTCQECQQRGIYLEAHHKKAFIDFPLLRYDINNGMTLCRKCHKKINKQQMLGNKNAIRN